jgi:hypothetical protein
MEYGSVPMLMKELVQSKLVILNGFKPPQENQCHPWLMKRVNLVILKMYLLVSDWDMTTINFHSKLLTDTENSGK